MQGEHANTLMTLREREREIAELQSKVVLLERQPAKVDTVTVTKPEIRTVVIENSEHIENLQREIKTQQESILKLREQLVTECIFWLVYWC